MELDLAPWITPAILVAVFAWLRSDIHRAEARINERMNERFGQVNERFGQMNERMSRIENELGEVKGELREVKGELGEVVKDLAEMKGKLTFVEGYILRRNDAAPEPAVE